MEIYGVQNSGFVATPNFKDKFKISNFEVKKELELIIRNPFDWREDNHYEFEIESDIEIDYECIRD